MCALLVRTFAACYSRTDAIRHQSQSQIYITSHILVYALNPPSELRKRTQRKHEPKADLERHIILHRAPDIYALHVALYSSIRHEMNPIALRRLHTNDQQTYEHDQRFGEDRDS